MAEIELTDEDEQAVQPTLARLFSRAHYEQSLRGLVDTWRWFVSKVERGYDDYLEEYDKRPFAAQSLGDHRARGSSERCAG